MKFTCAFCRKRSEKSAGEVNRAKKVGLNLYCNRKCAGRGRRKNKSKAQKRAEKAAYDKLYLAKNRKFILAAKALYFKKTYDPVKAAKERKKRMPKHVEYCRQPKYKEWKKKYDRQHRAKKFFGPFAEVAMLTWDLNTEIKERMTNAQIKSENQTAGKSQKREREGQQESRGRPRQRGRHRPTASVGQ